MRRLPLRTHAPPRLRRGPSLSRKGRGTPTKWGLTLLPAPLSRSGWIPSLGGEAVRWAVSRRPSSRGLGPLPGVLPELALLSVSPRAPRQGRSPGGSPRPDRRVPAPAVASSEAEARCRLRQEASAEPQPCLAVHGLVLGPPVRSSRAKPGPARRLRGRNPFAAGGSAPTCVPLLPDRRRAEAPRLSFDPEPESPKPGRFSKPAAFASAQGQARSFRLAAASSAALAFARPPHAWWDRRPLRSGCGWEGSPPLPVDRLGHGSEAVRDPSRAKGIRLWITRITGISGSAERRAPPAGRRGRSPP